jgi:hypothetical protein
MEKIKFPYRSDGHPALLHVIHESGAWEKLALHDHSECAEINPLSLWNLHYLRTLEG